MRSASLLHTSGNYYRGATASTPTPRRGCLRQSPLGDRPVLRLDALHVGLADAFLAFTDDDAERVVWGEALHSATVYSAMGMGDDDDLSDSELSGRFLERMSRLSRCRKRIQHRDTGDHPDEHENGAQEPPSCSNALSRGEPAHAHEALRRLLRDPPPARSPRFP